MGIVQDLLALQAKLADNRADYEQIWKDCVQLCMPMASERYDFSGGSASSSLTGSARKPMARERSRELYDTTAVWACERLTAGMESLITPRAQKWHSFSLDDPFGRDPTDMEEEWLDRLRDYHFSVRYDPRSNFSLANQKSLRSTVILGTGVSFMEQNWGRDGISPVKVPFFYRHIPLIEAYLDANAFDEIDTCCRVTEFSVRAAADYFGRSSLHEKMLNLLDKPAHGHDMATFMHVVLPRKTVGDGYSEVRKNDRFAEFWIDIDNSHLIRHSGFPYFPYIVSWWDQTDNSAYGQSAPMWVLSDIKMTQVMSKAATQAAQQMVKPPLATMAGLYNQRLNLNPGAVNPGYIDENGRLKAQPIITGANPTLTENLIEMKRAGIRESLYVNLFQILVQNPQQTATEALIRANEKGELLGPAGAKIESGLAKAVDNEVEIVGSVGAFNEGSPLQPPSTVAMHGPAEIGVKFTGPLAKLRRMQELQGVEAVLAVATNIGEYDASILDRIDGDETLEIVREIKGAPRKMFRTDEEVTGRRAAAAQRQEQLAAAQMTESLAGAAGKATPAIQAALQANRAAA